MLWEPRAGVTMGFGEGRRLGLGGPGGGRWGAWPVRAEAWRSAVAQCASRAGADWEWGAFWGEEAGKSGPGMHLIACISWRTRRRRMCARSPSPPHPSHPRFLIWVLRSPGAGGSQGTGSGENQKASRAVPQKTGCDPIFHRWAPSLRMGAAGLLRAPRRGSGRMELSTQGLAHGSLQPHCPEHV